MTNFLKISHFFNPTCQLSRPPSSKCCGPGAVASKSLEIQVYSIITKRLFRSENVYKCYFLAALILLQSKKSGGSIILYFDF